MGMNISPYEKGNIFNKDPLRVKRLLLHKAEIRKLDQQKMVQGYTLVPLEVYFKNGRVKVELGLAKGGVDVLVVEALLMQIPEIIAVGLAVNAFKAFGLDALQV